MPTSFNPSERMHLMKTIQDVSSTHKCPECGSAAYCAMEDGKSPNLCWCMQVASNRETNPLADAATCLCKKCLTGNL